MRNSFYFRAAVYLQLGAIIDRLNSQSNWAFFLMGVAGLVAMIIDLSMKDPK